MLEVLLVVHVVGLAVGWVLPGVEVVSPVLNTVLLLVLANGALLLLDEIFVLRRSLHIAVL